MLFYYYKLRLIIIAALSLLYTVVAAQYDSTKANKLFVGYRTGNAYYSEYETNKLLSEGTSGRMYLPTTAKQVHFITDSTICYSNKLVNGYQLVWIYKGDTIKANMQYDAMLVFGNNSIVCFNASGTEEIYLLNKNGDVTDIKIKGQVIGLGSKYLYYSVEDSASETVAARIYKYDVQKQGKPIAVADNILGDVAAVFKDRYLYSSKLTEGEYRPILIDLTNNKITYLEIADVYLNALPYLSVTGDRVVFYNTRTLDKYEYPFPK